MIWIKCGTCGTSQGYKTAADGKLTLSREEEARLVARGVADYVTRPVLNAVPDAGTPADGMEKSGQGVPLPDGENAAEGMAADDSANIPAYDIDMKADQLRSLLKRHDIPCNFGMSKADMVAALDAVFRPEQPAEEASGNGEAPPELGAEGPVV